MPGGVNAGEWIVARAATWPDFVRPKKGNPRPDIDKYHNGDFHFIDLPFIPSGEVGFDPDAVKAKAPNAITALEKYSADLKNSTDDVERAIALCWLLHVIGDIHQPLHANKLYSKQFPLPEGDRGGNFFFVPTSHHTRDLHEYWDGLLGTTAAFTPSGFKEVDATVMSIRGDQTLTRDALSEELKKKTFKEWADESHDMAVKVAYQNGNLKAKNNNIDSHIHQDFVPPLSPEAEKASVQGATRRGALAGYRLADTLNELLKAN
jgi:hypothetical protein